MVWLIPNPCVAKMAALASDDPELGKRAAGASAYGRRLCVATNDQLSLANWGLHIWRGPEALCNDKSFINVTLNSAPSSVLPSVKDWESQQIDPLLRSRNGFINLTKHNKRLSGHHRLPEENPQNLLFSVRQAYSWWHCNLSANSSGLHAPNLSWVHYYALVSQFYLDYYKIVVFPTRLSVWVTCPKEQKPERVPSWSEKLFWQPASS